MDFEIEHMMDNIPEGKKLLVKSDQKIQYHEELDIKQNYNKKKLIKNQKDKSKKKY